MSAASTASSLAAVAARIQERNNALRSELATLELLQAQHDHAKKSLESDKETSMMLRKEMLVAMRARHGLELECIRAKEESKIIEKSILELNVDIEDIRRQTKELQRKFDEEHAPLYAAHDLSTRAYSMKSEKTLIRAQKRKQEREEKLKSLRDQAKRQREEADSMNLERDQILEECLDMERREEEEDEETVALNLQIKSILAKKASIRTALNDAREKYQTAVDYRDSWESKCVRAGNAKY